MGLRTDNPHISVHLANMEKNVLLKKPTENNYSYIVHGILAGRIFEQRPNCYEVETNKNMSLHGKMLCSAVSTIYFTIQVQPHIIMQHGLH